MSENYTETERVGGGPRTELDSLVAHGDARDRACLSGIFSDGLSDGVPILGQGLASGTLGRQSESARNIARQFVPI